jgi:hypothetical protein
MAQSDLEHAQKAMQQQWYDLVMAEQQGNSLDVLEHMYDTYILLAEEYNRCYEAYQESQVGLRVASAPKRKGPWTKSTSQENEGHIKLAS